MINATDNLKDQLMTGLVFGLDAEMNRDMGKLVEIEMGVWHNEMPSQDRSPYRNPIYGWEESGPSGSLSPTWEYDTFLDRWCYGFEDSTARNTYFSGRHEGAAYSSQRNSLPVGEETFTVGFWVYMDSTNKDTSVHQLMMVLGSNSSYRRFQVYRHKTNHKLYVDCHTTARSTTNTISENEWHHVVIRHTGGQQIQNAFDIWIDGKSETLDSSSETNVLDLGTDMARIGSGDNTGKGLNGKIADFCVWNRILSDAEISVLSQKSFKLFDRKSRTIRGKSFSGSGVNNSHWYYKKFIAGM